MKLQRESMSVVGYDLELCLDRSKHKGELMDVAGGGGKGSTYTPPPVIPTPPVEEASVKIEDQASEKKTNTSKSQLKVPLSTTTDTGLNI